MSNTDTGVMRNQYENEAPSCARAYVRAAAAACFFAHITLAVVPAVRSMQQPS